ncbi:SGNH/GDSL hydrolase family protein [Planctomycetota bacterium]
MPKDIDAKKFDKAMRFEYDRGDGLQWHDPAQPPFRLQGFPWFEQDRVFRRMPVKPEHQLPEAVDNLAWHTTGGQVHFRSDTRQINIQVKLPGRFDMDHMPHTGMSGCDLYIGPAADKIYYHTARFEIGALEYSVCLFEHTEKVVREFTLNLPLYNGVQELAIGLTPDCAVETPPAYEDDRPVLIYGTSITHGGCASRPGMCFPNILSRRFNIPFVNLGFSGSGRAEAEVAHTIAAIPDPLLLAIDCEANCGPEGYYEERLPDFVNILREYHPQKPILVISRIPNITERFQEKSRTARLARVEFQKDLVAERKASGDSHIYFQDGSDLLEPHGHEGTVDTTHPNDVGFMNMANNLEPMFKKLISEYGTD